jgi:hypothetical protein
LTQVVTGKAERDSAAYRGWFIGHFVAAGPCNTDAVEVKWGVHALHETRARWARTAQATTLSMVIRGSIRLYFRDGEALLDEPGDYALWGPGVEHRWRIEADDTVILTVRWPSRAGDAADL